MTLTRAEGLWQQVVVAPTPEAEGAGRAGKQRVLNRDLKESIAKGGDEATAAIQLATLRALENFSHGPRARGGESTLDDLLGEGTPRHDFDESFGKTGARGSQNLVGLNRSIQNHPERWSQHVDQAMAKALGVDVGPPGIWSAREYGERRIAWGQHENLQRMWVMLSALHAADRNGEHAQVGANIGQYLKAVEMSARCGGNWELVWVMTDLPDPRPRQGSIRESLAHPAELAAATSFLREQQTLDNAVRGEGRQPWWEERQQTEDGAKGAAKGGGAQQPPGSA